MSFPGLCKKQVLYILYKAAFLHADLPQACFEARHVICRQQCPLLLLPL